MHLRFNQMSIEKLGIYLMDIHHPYVQKTLNTFQLCSTNIITTQTKDAANKLADVLKLIELIEYHLKTDNCILFPYIRLKLSGTLADHINECPFVFSEMVSEHDDMKELFNKIRLFTSDYTPAPESSPALKLCYAQWFNFELDMFRHIFLEEEILFPKLLLMKK